MENSLFWFTVLFSTTVILNVGAQTGLECLRCFSGVCDANSSQLTALVTSTDLECCDCFEYLDQSPCGSDPNSTVNVLHERFSSTPLMECCSNISRIIRTESYLLNTDQSNTCDGQYCFNFKALESQGQSIDPGKYIVKHFRFSQNGCIRSLMFQLSTSGVTELSGLVFTIYKEYSSRASSVASQLYEEIRSFSLSTGELQMSNVVRATPVASDICVETGDVLGFSVSSMAGFSLIRRVAGGDDIIYNVTDLSIEQPCDQLDGLIEALDVPGEDFILQGYDPLIAVELGSGSTTIGPSSTIPAISSAVPSQSLVPTVSTVTTEASSTSPPPIVQPTVLPTYAIIAIGVGGGICLLLLVVICIIAICLCRKRRHTTIVMKTHYTNGGARHVSTTRSARMEDLNKSGVITVDNPDADLEDTHNYDLPAELMASTHFYHELEPDSYKYTTMKPVEGHGEMQTGRLAATGQQLPTLTQADPEAYHDPTELGTTPQSFDGSQIALNPLYRTGAEANDEKFSYNIPSHYAVPTALIRSQDQSPPPPPFYHVLEGPTEKKIKNDSGDNIYTETGFGLDDELPTRESVFGSRYSLRSTSVDTASETPFSPATESTASESVLIPHYYHELENTDSPRSSVRSQPVIRIESEERPSSLMDSLERSLGAHRVYEPGIYVPGGEERQHLTVIKGDTSEEYERWRQHSYKASKSKKQFFEETLSFWEPGNAESDLYNQLSDRKFREILRDQIIFNSHLGVGQFGSVSKATWNNLQGGSKKVAVKTLKPTLNKEAKVAFLKEAAIMGQFCHSNVVQLYGVVTVGEPIMIVMELMALGDLDTYLYNNYRPGEMPPPHKKTLLSFSRQVACGMKYLARKNFVHRDLAARNVLVTETLVCKIGDFGMSRNLKDTNYYASRGGTVPIKWTAPEGLNYKKFSTASDVYSYGMVLYEIWSLGLKPLAHIKIQNVSQFVTEGNCQHPPPGCPRKIYEIMVRCWSPEQKDRPTFFEIFEILNGSNTELLSWTAEDQAQLSNLAMQLGAPLSEAKHMFLDLQKRNLVIEERIEQNMFLGTDV